MEPPARPLLRGRRAARRGGRGGGGLTERQPAQLRSGRGRDLLATLRSSPGPDAHLPGKCHLGPLPPRPTIAATSGATAAADPSFLALSVSSRLWLQLRLRLQDSALKLCATQETLSSGLA